MASNGKVCASCAKALKTDAKFCNACGALQQGASPPVSAAPRAAAPPSQTAVLAEAEGVKFKASVIKSKLIIRKKNGAVVAQIPLRGLSTSFHEAGRVIGGNIVFSSDAWGKGQAKTFRMFFNSQQQPSFEQLRRVIDQARAQVKGFRSHL